MPTAPRSLLLNGAECGYRDLLNHLADGVGLYRTEIPFMLQDSFLRSGSRPPAIGILETIGIARFACGLWTWGDKQLPYFPIVEENPFLGWRGDPAHPGSP